METQSQSDAKADVLVRVWGMDAEGHPFFQNAYAGNINNEGALLSGIAHPLKPGDIIGVQYADRKARFRVVWVVDAGPVRKIEAGVQILQNQQNPWPEMSQTATAAARLEGRNKRRFVRHKVLFPLEISFKDANRAHMQTNATDIGGRGCYVESMLPLALGTEIIICFWIDSEKVKTTGIVRASDPGVGMGIEFTALDNQVQQRLQQFLEKMDGGFAAAQAAGDGARKD
ncbi:MAG: PilZ domain-containing protein [Acidobacteriales bacterium]|nr:PilZ domain-containing protein [Terriglobales bacterium]